MDYNHIAAWGSFLSGVGTAIIGLLACALLYFDLRIRRRQLQESEARVQAGLSVELDVKLLDCATTDEQGTRPRVLQTQVHVKNCGHATRCLPAVYVSARALMGPTEPRTGPSRFYEYDVEKLPPCGPLSEPRNVARLPNSIWQIAPEENLTLVRWDLLDEEFSRLYPVVVVQVELFSSSFDLLGFQDQFFGRARDAWLDFMNGTNRADERRHNIVVFARALTSHGRIKRGQRVLYAPDSKEVDVENSQRFREILDSIAQCSLQHTVVLRHALPEGRGHQSVGM